MPISTYRIAVEAEAEAARLAPAAEAAVAAARAAAAALWRVPDQVTVPHLRHLAADRLSAWLAAHPDARNFQVVPTHVPFRTDTYFDLTYVTLLMVFGNLALDHSTVARVMDVC